MSDDDLPMGNADDYDDYDDEGSDDYAPPADLPDGVNKEILTEADSSNWRKPKKGDDVSVHYVGTLEADGTEFDSSRARGTPLKFTLGKGQVIKGWDLVVATMKKGEVAKATITSDFAYGDDGQPPKIPAKATLIFEIELLSWVSKDDLFGDEGVIKSTLEESKGWKTPKDGDEVKMRVGNVEMEYLVGSDSLGHLSKVVNKALIGMKKGEVASLQCSKEYVSSDKTPEGATVQITLHEIYESKDVSFAKNKSLMKKQVKEGDGYDTPKDASSATLAVTTVTDGSAPLPGFSGPITLEFTCGNGDVCDALECAATEMKKGEVAVITCSDSNLCKSDTKLGLAENKTGKIVLTVELTEFQKAKDTYNMSEDEKIEFGNARKTVGGSLFKQGRHEMALERYKKVIELLNYIDKFTPENKEKANELKRTCELNKAACYLKTGDNLLAKEACDKVLNETRNNVKALFRRATAQFNRGDYQSAMQDANKILAVEADNADAKRLIPHIKKAQREEDKATKSLYQNMLKGMGKSKDPIASSEEDKAATGEGGAEVEGENSSEK